MKKLILAATGAAVALVPLAAAPAAAADFNHNRYAQSQQYSRHDNRDNRGNRDNRFDNRRMSQNRFVQNHRWQRGERFDSRYASNYMVVGNPYYYNLRPAPRGYRWVRSGDDAVLIAITSGIIGAILANHF